MICFFEPVTFLYTSSVGDLLHSYHPELAIMKICFENYCCVSCNINIGRIVDLGKDSTIKALSVIKVERSPTIVLE